MFFPLRFDNWIDAWERNAIDGVIATREWVLRVYSTAGDTNLPIQILSLLDQKEDGIRQHYKEMRARQKKEEEVENEKKRRVSEVAVKIAEYVEDTIPLIVERIMNQLPQRKNDEQP